jgi:hypothetical protein
MKKILFLVLFFSAGIGFAQDTLSICSFNIQFLGHFKDRQNEILAAVLSKHDIVVVQEMVVPPVDGHYPDGTAYKKDAESAAFVKAMKDQGFSYWISNDNTGPSKNHTATTGNEWWIVFYNAKTVQPDSSRCYGFVSVPLAANSTFERVPYAFPFRSVVGKSNFTLVSVHLKPGDSPEEEKIRNGELKALFFWTGTQLESNHDFYVLGDCNIYEKEEFESFSTVGIYSLNEACLSTNTKMYESESKGEPYDHVFYRSMYSTEDMLKGSFHVVDLMEEIKKIPASQNLRLEPYVHDDFRVYFSDHVPVFFQLITGRDTDL